MSGDPLEMLRKAAQIIFDKKGSNILALDVRGVSSLTDYILIAEGNVDRHVSAMAQDLIKTFKEEGEKPLYVEGLASGEWVVIDYLDYMVHLFTSGMRDKYRLEELFQEGEVVDLKIETLSN